MTDQPTGTTRPSGDLPVPSAAPDLPPDEPGVAAADAAAAVETAGTSEPALTAIPEPVEMERLAATVAPARPGGAGSAAPPGPGAGLILGFLAAAVLGGAIAIGGLAATGSLAIGPGASPTPAPTATPAPTPTPAALPLDGQALGRADAAVTVELWSDYQCPYCKLIADAVLPALVRQYVAPGTVRVVLRDYSILGQESIDAAVAARCAGRQDPAGYWRYHDFLFAFQQGENQGRFVRANLVELATYAGFAEAAFTACLDDAAVSAAVAAETAEGAKLGVDSTPTLRVIGPGGTETLRGFGTWPELAATIERVLRPAPSATPAGSASPAASATPAAPAPPAPSATPAPTAPAGTPTP